LAGHCAERAQRWMDVRVHAVWVRFLHSGHSCLAVVDVGGGGLSAWRALSAVGPCSRERWGAVQSLERRVVACLGQKFQTDGRLSLPFGPGNGRNGEKLGFGLLMSLSCFVLPPILVPGLHLRIVQSQLVRHLHAVLHAQVLLPFERLLQRLQLIVGECGSRLPLLLAQPMRPIQLQAAVHAISVLIFSA
jgi:hypothetical protein